MQVVDALLAAQGSSLSAAKRNRLRCLKAAVLAMAQPDGPRVAAEAGGDRTEATKQVCRACSERDGGCSRSRLRLAVAHILTWGMRS